jgi:hypothetical protein
LAERTRIDVVELRPQPLLQENSSLAPKECEAVNSSRAGVPRANPIEADLDPAMATTGLS